MAVLPSVIRVRTPCRQFHRRQVAPWSSRQMTSPGSITSDFGSPFWAVSNVSPPCATTNWGVPA